MKTEWDLTKIFENKEAWENGKLELEKEIQKWDKMTLNMTSDTKCFLEALQQKIKVDALIEKVYCYPKRFLDLDNQDTEKMGMFEVAKNLYSKILELTEKFTSNILENASFTQEFLKDYPYYQRYIEIVRKNVGET